MMADLTIVLLQKVQMAQNNLNPLTLYQYKYEVSTDSALVSIYLPAKKRKSS